MKFVQISASESSDNRDRSHSLYALDEEGNVWSYDFAERCWEQMPSPDFPQEKYKW